VRLLVSFLAATLTMVGAVVLLLRGSNDWVDFVALALLLAVAGAVLTVVAREIAEEEPGASEDLTPPAEEVTGHCSGPQHDHGARE
jgi:hypothetical protein